jgi:hypothetical protein
VWNNVTRKGHVTISSRVAWNAGRFMQLLKCVWKCPVFFLSVSSKVAAISPQNYGFW